MQSSSRYRRASAPPPAHARPACGPALRRRRETLRASPPARAVGRRAARPGTSIRRRARRRRAAAFRAPRSGSRKRGSAAAGSRLQRKIPVAVRRPRCAIPAGVKSPDRRCTGGRLPDRQSFIACVGRDADGRGPRAVCARLTHSSGDNAERRRAGNHPSDGADGGQRLPWALRRDDRLRLDSGGGALDGDAAGDCRHPAATGDQHPREQLGPDRRLGW